MWDKQVLSVISANAQGFRLAFKIYFSKNVKKTKSLFTRSHIICETCFNLFFLSLQVFEGSRTGKDCSKGKFGSSKKTETCMR